MQIYQEDFENLKLGVENIKLYLELDNKDEVIEIINEMREELNEIERELNTMSDLGAKKQNKVDEAKKILDSKNIIYKEMQYGQLQVDKANYWATTEKWHDPVRKAKGVGINSFFKHLRDNNII